MNTPINTESSVPEYSSNKRAEQLLGRRDENGPIGVILFAPVEQGYACPVHGAETEETLGETLHWSEYNAFVWCSRCDKDYPSALCATATNRWHPDASTIDAQIRVYLESVAEAVARATADLKGQILAVEAVQTKAREMGRPSFDPDGDPAGYDQGFADAAQGLSGDLNRALRTSASEAF